MKADRETVTTEPAITTMVSSAHGQALRRAALALYTSATPIGAIVVSTALSSRAWAAAPCARTTPSRTIPCATPVSPNFIMPGIRIMAAISTPVPNCTRAKAAVMAAPMTSAFNNISIVRAELSG